MISRKTPLVLQRAALRALLLLALIGAAGPASAALDAPCGVTYHAYAWPVLGIGIPLFEPGPSLRCQKSLVHFQDVENPP